MLFRKRAWDLMREDFAWVDESASLAEAVRVMRQSQQATPENNVVLVMSKGALKGAVSIWNVMKAVDALVLRTLKSRGVTVRSTLHGRTVRVEYAGCDVLMLWTKPDAGYICIEPWCNAPDFVDADERIDRKPGFMPLAAGEARSHTHTITIR